MHVLQHQLQDTTAARRVASDQVRELERKHAEIAERGREQAKAIEAARAEIRKGAATGGNADAAKRFREFSLQAEITLEELAGVAADVEAAQAELERKQAKVTHALTVLARHICYRLERQATRELRTFARTLAHRHAVARLVRAADPDDPLGFSNANGGARVDFQAVLLSEGLRGFAPSVESGKLPRVELGTLLSFVIVDDDESPDPLPEPVAAEPAAREFSVDECRFDDADLDDDDADTA